MTELPLTGVRVVDMADERAELAGRLLADLGADVVRVEPPGGGRSRRLPPFHGDESLYFAARNTNKRGASLDVGVPADRERLLELLGAADVWIETTSPGELAGLGLDPARVSCRHPDLVVASITDFGQTGPYRDHVATDPVMVAMSWMLFRAGVPDLPPVLPPGAIAHDVAGITGAFAVLAGLLQRRRGGAAPHLDVSVIEAVQQTTDWGLASFSFVDRARPGSYAQTRSGGGQIYPIVPCRDGWVRPSIVTRAEWRKMRAWLGEPEALQDEHWDQTAARVEIYHDVIEPLLVEHFADMTMTDAAEEGQRRRIPITPLLRPADVLAADHYRESGTFVDGEVAPGVTGAVASGFFLVDGERVGYRRPAPALADGPVAWAGERVPSSVETDDDISRGPFTGIRVLDFGVAGAAPEIARLLGEYGADVIRVESPRRPDLFRQLGGPTGMSPVFASSSRTKRSFGVDFEHPDAIDLVKALVASADIVVENLPPGSMDGFGLGWDELRRVNPSLVMISSQTMGTRGPWKEWRGYGANTQPPGGMTYLWSFPDAPAPVASNVAFPDHVVGRLGATVAAALLLGRERRGVHVEIVQAEVAINLLADLYLRESLAPGSVGPAGNRSERGAPWGVYPCAGEQRWCVITCRDDDDWRRLRAALGDPAWAVDPALDHVDGRRAHHDEIDERIAEWSSTRPDAEVMAVLQAAGVPAGKMMYVGDVPTDPHLVDRGYPLPLDQTGLGPILVEGPGFHGDPMSGPITTPAPLLGEHTCEIAGELLGLETDEIERLIDAGALHAPPGM